MKTECATQDTKKHQKEHSLFVAKKGGNFHLSSSNAVALNLAEKASCITYTSPP